MTRKTACLMFSVVFIGCAPDDPGYRELDAKVVSLQWTRTVDLQKSVTRHGEGWKRQMPAGAFNTSCQSRQNGYYDCNPYVCGYETVSYPCGGYECGCYEVCDDYDCWLECDWCYDTCYTTEAVYCYQSCPRYEDWCRYDYHEWQTIDQKTVSGQGHTAVWPTLTAGSGERTVQHEDYRVGFMAGESAYEYRTESYSDYTRFSLGAVWRIRVHDNGAVEPMSLTAD